MQGWNDRGKANEWHKGDALYGVVSCCFVRLGRGRAPPGRKEVAGTTCGHAIVRKVTLGRISAVGQLLTYLCPC